MSPADNRTPPRPAIGRHLLWWLLLAILIEWWLLGVVGPPAPQRPAVPYAPYFLTQVKAGCCCSSSGARAGEWAA